MEVEGVWYVRPYVRSWSSPHLKSVYREWLITRLICIFLKSVNIESISSKDLLWIEATTVLDSSQKQVTETERDTETCVSCVDRCYRTQITEIYLCNEVCYDTRMNNWYYSQIVWKNFNLKMIIFQKVFKNACKGLAWHLILWCITLQKPVC